MKTHWADLEGVVSIDCKTMSDVRREIDRVDRALVHMLAQRLTYIERAGQIKKDRSAVRDEQRIQDVLNKVGETCRQVGFPVTIAEPVWRQLMDGCIAHEFDVYDDMQHASKKTATA